MAKGFIKGLAAGAVLGAVAAIVGTMKDKNQKAAELQKAAKQISAKIARHAKKLGSLTKSAYDNIVESTVEEYKGLKTLSKSEVADLTKELKSGWKEVQKMIK